MKIFWKSHKNIKKFDERIKTLKNYIEMTLVEDALVLSL